MTFGFYSAPTPGQERGLYLFNAPNLSEGPLNHIGALNYHELVPGHHFHLATQEENEPLHPLRRTHLINPFNEGWAEYAATLDRKSVVQGKSVSVREDLSAARNI